MTALRLAQGSILESRIQQLAEAWMIGTGVQITQHNGDVALLLSGRQFPQTDDAGGPFLASAHRRLRMCRNKRDATHRIDREAYARHVGRGNHRSDRRHVAWFNTNPHTVESAIIRSLVLPQLTVRKQIRQSRSVQLRNQIVCQFLQCKYCNIMFFDRTDDCRSVGATESAVECHHTEMAMFRGFRNSFITCFTRCFTLFRKSFGNPLRSIGRIEIFHPICDFAQQRRKTDRRSDSPESRLMQRETGDGNHKRRNPQQRNQRNQIRQRQMTIPTSRHLAKRNPYNANNQRNPKRDNHSGNSPYANRSLRTDIRKLGTSKCSQPA